MGFKRMAYRLDWPEGSPLHGLEISMRSASLGVITQLTRFQSLDPSSGQLGADEIHTLNEVCSTIAGLITLWNFEDDNDEPIPVTPESVRDMDFGILIAVIGAYLNKVVSIGAPLGVPSASGSPSPVPPIPMETL